MSTSEKKQLTLKTSDGQEFVVEESAAVLSETIKNMVEDDCASTTIPIPNVDGKTMAKIIVYCKKHSEESDAERLKSFDAQFMKENDDQADLFDLILAANFLNIKGLVDLVAQTVADIIKGCNTPKAIRERFKIKNDFTPEEEEEIHKENTWALE